MGPPHSVLSRATSRDRGGPSDQRRERHPGHPAGTETRAPDGWRSWQRGRSRCPRSAVPVIAPFMPGVAGHGRRPRRTRALAIAAVGCSLAVALAILLLEEAPHAENEQYASTAILVAYDAGIPDDTVLLEQLEDAVDLRRREDFDRMLDARDPGRADRARHPHRVGVRPPRRRHRHALRRRRRAVRLPRSARRTAGAAAARTARRSTTRRGCAASITGAAGGPDAFGCFSCHSKGGPDGAGTQTQNAFLRGDGERIGGADQRNPPHLLGLGPVALLAREMSAELQRPGGEPRASARRRKAGGSSRRSTAKGVSFGRIAAEPDGTLDYAGVEGVDRGSHGPSVRLEGPPGHAARHGRGVAPHPSGPALEPHPARGPRRHPRRGVRTGRARGTTSTRTASRSRSTPGC